MLVECTRLPLVPVTVIWYVPGETFLFVFTVSTDVPAFTTDRGLNFAFANFGTLLAESVTVPLKPAPAAIVTLYVALAPGAIVTPAGGAEIEKSPLTTTS